MRRLKTISVCAVAAIIFCLVASFGWRSYQRSQLPKYEGETVDEWVDFFAVRFDEANIYLDELLRKELRVVFGHFEPEDIRELAREFCSVKKEGAYSKFVDLWNSQAPIDWELMPPFVKWKKRWNIIDLAEKLGDSEIRETVKKLRRHIELNDQLRSLRNDGNE